MSLQQFNMGTQQHQQLRLQQQQQLRLMRLLIKIIKANGLADGDFGLYRNTCFILLSNFQVLWGPLQPNKIFIRLSDCIFVLR